MSEIKQLFSQTLVYGFSSVLARVLNFLLVPLYTVLFIPSEYAIVSEMYAYAAFIMVLGSCGMETAFFRFSDSTNFSKSKVFGTAFNFILINAIIILFLGALFYKKIGNLIQHNQNPEYVLFFLFIISLDLITIIPFALLRQKNKAFKFASIKTINIIINIFFNLFFLLFCPYCLDHNFCPEIINIIYSPDVSVGYVFISNLIASTMTLLILIPDIKKHIGQPDYGVFKKMFYYSWPILIAGVAFIINESADKILIKYLLPKGIAMRELGIYSACYKLSIFMTLFVQAYRFAAEPFFFNQVTKPNAKKVYALMLEVFILFALAIFLFVTLYIDVIKLVIPNTLYHEGIVIIPIVLLANIFLGVYYNLSVWYKVTNKTKYAAFISSFGAICTIFFNMILLPRYGYIGAAWTTLICYVVMTAISFYLGQKYFKISYQTQSLALYFLIALGLFYVSRFYTNTSYMNIQIDNTILFVLYLIFIYWQLKKLFKRKYI